LVHAESLKVDQNQGDQIGPFFAHWTNVYFGQCFKNYRSRAYFGAICSTLRSHVIISTNNGVGNILVDLFTNSSGHPEQNRDIISPNYIDTFLIGKLRILAKYFAIKNDWRGLSSVSSE
jgi:hypothetical protein